MDSDNVSEEELNEFERIADNYEPYVGVKKRSKVLSTYQQANHQQKKGSDIKAGPRLSYEEDEQNEHKVVKHEKQAQHSNPNVADKNNDKQHNTTRQEHDYKQLLKTSWLPPKYCLDLSQEQMNLIRTKFHILVNSSEMPPCPLTSFKEMKLNKCLLKALKSKNIHAPTPIQIQGLPVVLSGRDIIGIAFSGSGKTLTFILPMIMFSIEQEIKLPFKKHEGPFGLILVPSRELAKQIHDNIQYLCEKLAVEYPSLRNSLCIGGVALHDQINSLKDGCHILVATPGRLLDLLNKNIINLNMCRMLCIDEADRLIDMEFDEELKNIFDHFKYPRQTMLFSCSMQKKIADFALSDMNKPVIINVNRTIENSLNVIQEIELVSEDSKMATLMRCLQKTPPPVIVLTFKKNDVCDIIDYLLSKQVEAVAIHGDKDQSSRQESIQAFKNGSKAVLVATDLASKGLDFPVIKHVINYDMPHDLDTYIHRIGRTGRCGRSGIATTFINKACDINLLVQLKQYLIDCKQKVPGFLLELKSTTINSNFCSKCGSSTHSNSTCTQTHSSSSTSNQPKTDIIADNMYNDW